MLPIQDVIVVLTCENPRRLPRTLKFYKLSGEPALEIAPRKKIFLSQRRVLCVDCNVDHLWRGESRHVDSVREIEDKISGLHGGNAAGISRISIRAEDATVVLELRTDGSISEGAWHHLGPTWGSTIYRNPDGTQSRPNAPPERPDDEMNPTWGFKRYGWDETHPQLD